MPAPGSRSSALDRLSCRIVGRPDTPPRTRLDEIECDGCGRSFVTTDGPGMIAIIKGPCPDCAGTFRLMGTDIETTGEQDGT